jgi:hypothetical protein
MLGRSGGWNSGSGCGESQEWRRRLAAGRDENHPIRRSLSSTSEEFDANIGIPKCRSFDFAWPKIRPNFAQDDQLLRLMTIC